MVLKDRLKELRKARKLLQKDIAKLLNITTSAYSTYETGVALPTADTLSLLATFFGVSVDYLLDREEKSCQLIYDLNNNGITIDDLNNLDPKNKAFILDVIAHVFKKN